MILRVILSEAKDPCILFAAWETSAFWKNWHPTSETRGEGQPRVKSKPILRTFLHLPVYLYRWRLGWLFGHRFLLLTHIGRRSGKHFQTVLEVMEYCKEKQEAIVMSGFGRNSNWLRNIETNGWAEVDIASEHFRAEFRFLGDDEAIRVVASYEQRNRFMLPIVHWVLSRLLGWNYTDSDADRHKLVQQLPLMAFRPR
jgi:deazaflavin-dependent oxidoreductase (nitroreductase family)